jgi:hypothetical protein
MGKCLCGAETNYSNGPLGYRAYICSGCGHHWRLDTDNMDEQIYVYQKTAEAKELCKGSDDLSIDEDPVVNKAKDGAWVAVWLWVPDDYVEPEPELLSSVVEKILYECPVVNSGDSTNEL